ncbi:MAG: glycosyltransferase family 2 protein [Lautropia sp.]
MISIVVPVYNEVENLSRLVDAIGTVMLAYGRPFELLVVDDGSRDRSRELLAELAGERAWLKPHFLVRNYGQSTALQAGFDNASGGIVVTLDGDLQNDPADIPMLLGILEDNPDVDCVSGWRQRRQDATLSRKLPSRLANLLISRVTRVQLHDYGCALKAYRAHVIHELHLYGEQHRFIPALAAEVGAKIVEVPVNHEPRRAGKSKYGVDRTVRVLLDLLWIRFTMHFLHRPMHAFGGIAFVMVASGLTIMAWLAGLKLVTGESIGNRPLLLLGGFLTLIGVQFLATGLLGELLTRIYHEPLGRKQYLLDERFGAQADSTTASRAAVRAASRSVARFRAFPIASGRPAAASPGAADQPSSDPPASSRPAAGE